MAVLEATERQLEKALHPFFVTFSWLSAVYFTGFLWMNFGSQFAEDIALLQALCVFATGLAGLALFGLFFAVVAGCISLSAMRRLTDQSSACISKNGALCRRRTRLDNGCSI
ncbi:hypothetical protein IMCC21224_112936 [Puniceibacterium sp. IMCC21224]|nr:hypothetical protein IMCC21224_112936 [Puniceibacterium sp. IMCC21224]